MSNLTQDDVHTTARRLMEEGRPVTILNIRALLGRGSNTTINRHLQGWRALHDRPAPSRDTPSSATFRRLIMEARAEARTEFARDRQQIEEAMAANDSLVEELQTKVHRLELTNTKLEGEITTVKAERDRSMDEVLQIRVSHQRLTETLDRALSSAREERLAGAKERQSIQGQYEALRIAISGALGQIQATITEVHGVGSNRILLALQGIGAAMSSEMGANTKVVEALNHRISSLKVGSDRDDAGHRRLRRRGGLVAAPPRGRKRPPSTSSSTTGA